MPAVATTHPFAWAGLALDLPADWNLTFHQGDARQGVLRFADLHTTRLELRWRTPRSPRRHVDALLAAARKRGLPVTPFDGASRIPSGAGTLLLVGGPVRVVELFFPAADDFAPPTARALIASVAGEDRSDYWLFEVYGARGHVHKKLALRKTSLLPGATRLEFSRGLWAHTLGSFALADRLLAGRTLRAWAAATIPLVRNNTHGAWFEDDSNEVFAFDARAGLLRRRVRHELVLCANDALNVIRWHHSVRPPGRVAP